MYFRKSSVYLLPPALFFIRSSLFVSSAFDFTNFPHWVVISSVHCRFWYFCCLLWHCTALAVFYPAETTTRSTSIWYLWIKYQNSLRQSNSVTSVQFFWKTKVYHTFHKNTKKIPDFYSNALRKVTLKSPI